jgi:tetratricopeptide (TPR) repeat protein
VGQLQKTAEDFVRRLPGGVGTAVATLPLGSTIRFESNRSATVVALRKAFEGITRRGAGLEGIAGFGCTDEAASAGCGNQGVHPSINAPEARRMNSAAEWLLRGRKALTDLQWLFRTLAGGPPSDVVIVSGALPFQSRLRPEIDATFTVARTAGIRVHAVEIADLARVALPEGGPEGPLPLTLESLREKHAAAYGLPEETGGLEALGAVSGADFFTQLAHELSSTYLLSFEPIDTDRDGKPHRIDVRLSRRPPLTIHAQKTFIALAAPWGPALGEAPPARATAATTATLTPVGPPTKTDAWVALVHAHQPGARDRALLHLAEWNSYDLKKAANGLSALRRRVPADTLNDTLLRGALLHTDLTLVAPDLAYRFDGFPEWGTLHTLEAEDGQALGSGVVSAHWRLARVLLDRVQPRPGDDPRVREWYRAVGATLLASRRHAEALHHLRDAQRLFPRDRDVNMLSGLLHEMLAAAASEVLLGDAQTALNTAASQLQAARRYLTRAVDADPAYDAAQLHLGRVCHLLGDDEAASNALASVLSRTNDPNIRYVAELVAGSIHEAAGRLDVARESFERAATLQPQAQSALVALSHVAREAGNRADAVRYIERLAALPLQTKGRDDPWWHYESAAVADHAALLSTLRAILRTGRVP